MDAKAEVGDELKKLHRLVAMVVDRLASRAHVHSLAREIVQARWGERGLGWPCVGEADENLGTTCKSGSASVVFICPTTGMDAFSCDRVPGGFNCQTTVTYNNPPCAGVGIDCASFGCTAGGNQGMIFECQAFSCSTTYNCKLALDFVCGGNFTCQSGNDCNSGHIYLCNTTFTCVASHTCTAGSQGTTQCNAQYIYNVGGDTNPNDFYCGDPNPASDTFECRSTFACNSNDDFVCSPTTAFECESTDSPFHCTNQFHCVGTFSCVPTAAVNCDVGTTYSCNKDGGYGCGSDRTGDYMCRPSDGNFNCTPDSGKFGCAPTFGYSCTPQIGTYNCMPGSGSGGYNCVPSGGGGSYNCQPSYGNYTCTVNAGGYNCTPNNGGYNCSPISGSGGYTCTPNDESLTRTILALESAQFSTASIAGARQGLAQLVRAVKHRLGEHHAPARCARVFGRTIFQEFGFRRRGYPSNTQFTLTGTLLGRGGSCLGLTTVYVCASEAVGLPMRPMLFEGHIAVGYAGASPALHIEPSRYGACVTPETSLLIWGAPVGAEGGLLTRSQFLAVHFSNHAAFVLAPQGRWQDASFLLDQAIELFPEYKTAWINKAIIALELGEEAIADESLTRVMVLRPGPRYQKIVDHVLEQVREPHLRSEKQKQRLPV